MAAYNKFNAFLAAAFNGNTFNFSSDAIQVILCVDAPNAGNSFYGEMVEISSNGGYPVGGITLNLTSSGESVGTQEETYADDVVFTASGGAFDDFRYVVLYDQTASGQPLIAWYDNGSIVSMNDGDTFTVDFDNVNGVFQAA